MPASPADPGSHARTLTPQAEPPGAEDSAAAVTPGAAPGSALSSGSGGEGTPYAGVQLRSRVASIQKMGGIPALGGGLVLPRMTPGQRPQLNATASPAGALQCLSFERRGVGHEEGEGVGAMWCLPALVLASAAAHRRCLPLPLPSPLPAAVEIMRGRLGSGDADATPLRKTGGEEEGAAPTPLVQLRAAPAASRMAGTPGAAAPESELAAAMARRMQRLGVSPDKEPAAAAESVACGG